MIHGHPIHEIPVTTGFVDGNLPGLGKNQHKDCSHSLQEILRLLHPQLEGDSCLRISNGAGFINSFAAFCVQRSPMLGIVSTAVHIAAAVAVAGCCPHSVESRDQ